MWFLALQSSSGVSCLDAPLPPLSVTLCLKPRYCFLGPVNNVLGWWLSDSSLVGTTPPSGKGPAEHACLLASWPGSRSVPSCPVQDSLRCPLASACLAFGAATSPKGTMLSSPWWAPSFPARLLDAIPNTQVILALSAAQAIGLQIRDRIVYR